VPRRFSRVTASTIGPSSKLHQRERRRVLAEERLVELLISGSGLLNGLF
jgi:hypothetical protein